MRAFTGTGHRERLLRGMVDACAKHGYRDASVAKVIATAGVSRATFYECFRDREECFMVTGEELAAEWGAVLQAAACQPEANPLKSILGGLLSLVAEDPAAARLLFVDALGSGPAARDHHERLIAAVEGELERVLGLTPPGMTQLELPATALLGGVAGVLAMRLTGGDKGSWAQVHRDLLAWVDSHSLPVGVPRLAEAGWVTLGAAIRGSSGSEPPPPAPSPLPRGRRALPPQQAAEVRRNRILDAVVRLVAERGYAALTVAEVVATARVTRQAFYSHFSGKEEAFLALQTIALQESSAAAASGFLPASAWPEKVWAGTREVLAYMARNPQLSYLAVAELYAVGEEAARRGHDSRMAYRIFLEDGYRLRDGAELPGLCSAAIASAIFALMRRQVTRGRATGMLEILPQCAYVSLAPFLGPVAALRFIEARARPAR